MMKTLLQLLKSTLVILLLFCGIGGAVFLGLGLLLSFHADKPEKADVIIVLGGDDGLRINRGAELYKAGYARHLLLTGIDRKYYRPDRPDWRERRLMEKGISRKVIDVDTLSKTTWDEARNTRKIMKEKGWGSALIVSDPPHMLRLHNTWSRAFRESPATFVLVATNPEWWHPLLWWRNETSYKFVMSEIRKNVFYAVMYY
ncbi:YdcF family protein [Prosthecochloris sp. GSB1]|uniref:YdcF family protein n=1 Tax=Prosthecochloris sp. GSB1 TaxID=281093 RepID=UPI001F48F973|nr:YdcF family protein [Prosthecochloris sp. GSB1]